MEQKEKRFFSISDLENIHMVAEDFGQFLINKEEVEKKLAENPNFQSGLNYGIKSALILLNDFLIGSNGQIDRETLEKLVAKVSKSQN